VAPRPLIKASKNLTDFFIAFILAQRTVFLITFPPSGEGDNPYFAAAGAGAGDVAAGAAGCLAF
jgi:hypothetical protein